MFALYEVSNWFTLFILILLGLNRGCDVKFVDIRICLYMLRNKLAKELDASVENNSKLFEIRCFLNIYCSR